MQGKIKECRTSRYNNTKSPAKMVWANNEDGKKAELRKELTKRERRENGKGEELEDPERKK